MRRTFLTILCICLLFAQMPVDANLENSEVETKDPTDDIIERTVHAEGTQYDIQVNTSNHTVQVSAVHLADNETSAGYVVQVNDNRVIDVFWEASNGEQNHTEADLMYNYDAAKEAREITFSTYGGSANITYNFTVPQKYQGRYLRPTLTDVSFERVNESWGRVKIAVRSDAQYYYPAYVLVWTPNTGVKALTLHREKGENITRDSFMMRVGKEEPFQGEIRMHTGNVSQQGPLHSQYELAGTPRNPNIREVSYEPISRDNVTKYSYKTRSLSLNQQNSKDSDSSFRMAIGALAVLLVLVILVAVAVSSSRRRV